MRKKMFYYCNVHMLQYTVFDESGFGKSFFKNWLRSL